MSSPVTLRRVLKFRTVVSTSTGLAYAAISFLGCVQLAYYLAGDSAWIAILISGLLAVLAALCFSELNSLYPTAAAIRLYMKEAFNDNFSLVITLGYLLTVVAAIAADSYIVGKAITYTLNLPNWASLIWILALLGLALIVLVQQNLHTNVGIIGIIFSIGSAGGLLGALIAGPIKAHLRFGPIIIATTVAEALAVALLAVAASPIMLMIGMGIISTAIPIFGVTQLSYRQSIIPDSMQGRTSSVFDMLFFGGQPLGAAIGGLLIGPLGPRAVLWGIALGLGLSALVVGLTAIRKV